jgi:lincosamide nucleotidyltransferase A/C/D/E
LNDIGRGCELQPNVIHPGINLATIRSMKRPFSTCAKPSVETQIKVIKEVTNILDELNLPYWMFGGWAVDFAAGRITRDHGDIDLVIWRSDRRIVLDRLGLKGFVPGESERPAHQIELSRSGLHLEINLIEETSDGTIVCPGDFSDWPWLRGSFGTDIGAIGELRVRIVSPSGQLEAKEGFPRHRLGAPHRAKDIHDIEILKEIIRTAT